MAHISRIVLPSSGRLCKISTQSDKQVEFFQMKTVDTTNNGNPGIVPPWLGKTPTPKVGDKNPGIVPPWLTDTPKASGNALVATDFVRESVVVSPPNATTGLMRF